MGCAVGACLGCVVMSTSGVAAARLPRGAGLRRRGDRLGRRLVVTAGPRRETANAIKRAGAGGGHHRVMSAATDTFVAFVDVLADALDDHEATSEDLAARLYLSRYHFDRLISSVAGEPPRGLPAADPPRAGGVSAS